MGNYKSTITCAVTTAGKSSGHSANHQVDTSIIGLPRRFWNREDKSSPTNHFTEEYIRDGPNKTTCLVKCSCGKILTKVLRGDQSPRIAAKKLKKSHICGEQPKG